MSLTIAERPADAGAKANVIADSVLAVGASVAGPPWAMALLLRHLEAPTAYEAICQYRQALRAGQSGSQLS